MRDLGVLMKYDPNANLVGGFSDTDGTINFYLRINSLLNDDSIVLDFGAGFVHITLSVFQPRGQGPPELPYGGRTT